ncbi:sensor histidine kinase [Streptomyces sp. NPDC002855]|uniref:sensor histidine kinase n=1 Tax=Streptomyces sp. NPDC002855 TaxID=3154437 RepID=UPI003316C5A9
MREKSSRAGFRRGMPGFGRGTGGFGRGVARGRIAHRPETPVAAAALLALGAVSEVLLRADGDVPLPLALSLALGTTVPVAVLAGGDRMAQPSAGQHPFGASRISRGYFAAAVVLAGVAGMLSLAPFHVLTGAGLCALLVALHQAGRRGLKYVAGLLPLPFIAYAVSVPAGSDAGERFQTVLTAVGAAVAAGTGLARSARDTALVNSATEQAIADTLLEHVARGERARIARELHDVVAHHISMIAVQAETARLTTPGLPAVGAERFLAIGDTARMALTEMRRLLGVLREDAGGGTTPDRRPQPGLEQLGELVDEARDASAAAVRLIVEGPVRPLDPGLELTAYRIVQEALTNTRRHAPGAAVDVELRYTQDALRLRVRDNGPSPHTSKNLDAGHGLVGMRERAAMVGGELRAGPARRGGFLIEATFPAPVREHAA